MQRYGVSDSSGVDAEPEADPDADPDVDPPSRVPVPSSLQAASSSVAVRAAVSSRRAKRRGTDELLDWSSKGNLTCVTAPRKAPEPWGSRAVLVRLAWALMERADHYRTLGVAAGASHIELRSAYRRLMREHHPDLRPGDPAAEAMTRRLTEAWAVLGRPGRRAAYDRARAAMRVTAPPPLRSQPTPPAYSREGHDYRRAFHLASLKAATAVFLFGLGVLLTLSR